MALQIQGIPRSQLFLIMIKMATLIALSSITLLQKYTAGVQENPELRKEYESCLCQ